MSTLTEVVDARIGRIRASGHLTAQGADLLRGTAEELHRRGHERVLLDLRDVQAADDAGLHVLRDAARSLAARGGRLLVRGGVPVAGGLSRRAGHGAGAPTPAPPLPERNRCRYASMARRDRLRAAPRPQEPDPGAGTVETRPRTPRYRRRAAGALPAGRRRDRPGRGRLPAAHRGPHLALHRHAGLRGRARGAARLAARARPVVRAAHPGASPVCSTARWCTSAPRRRAATGCRRSCTRSPGAAGGSRRGSRS